jgi:serine/threonine-protein kinase
MTENARAGPLRLGEKFQKYVIRRLVGRGGHAWVCHGHDPFLERDVAIKVLHRPGGATRDMLRRGHAEAKLLYRLKHPNIVEVLDAGITDEGLLYIVMELLEGRTLREILRARGRLSVRDALPLFVRMTEGVEAAHSAGAIHRDLKPENVFLLHDNTPKILDFGIAKLVDSAGITTEKDVLHGTMLYMAPEQLDGYRATARSDVYAFGLTLYETLVGRHPCLLAQR